MRFLVFLCCISLFAQHENVAFRSQVPLNQFGLNPSAGNDIWGFTDANGREYAIMGATNGTTVFDITDPDNPVEVGNVPGNNSTWRDVKTYVYNNTPGSFSAYAFVTTEADQGLQIIDLSNVPNDISLAATYTGNGFSSAHNIYIEVDGGSPYAYLLGANLANGGVVVLDISNPLAPVQTGTWDDFYVHDFYLGSHWADPNYNGSHIGLAMCGSNNLSVIDFTDKANPQTLLNYTYPNITYCHSGWVGEGGRYAYLCDELDEGQLNLSTTIYVLDLIDLSSPELVATWTGPTRATDHNAFVKGQFLHLSNYSRGYTVLDLADPLNLTEFAFYDTFPDSNGPSFDGAWGVFPYYESGVVAVSDIQGGLFILQPEIEPGFGLTLSEDGSASCQGQDQAIDVSVASIAGFTNPVTLSLAGLPTGVDASWSVNPVTPGGTTRLLLSNTNSATPGRYDLTISGSATDGEPRNAAFDFEILSGTDTPPSLLLPANNQGCTGITAFDFSWQDLGFNRSYVFQVASDASFNQILVEEIISATSLTLSATLAANRTHFWRVRSDNACGTGSFGEPRSFFTSVPAVLLVDDDDNNPDMRGYYTDLLETQGLTYDIYDIGAGSANGPTLQQMTPYRMVMWFSGDQYGNNEAGPNASDEIVLASYLDQGGKLFLSSQDYLYDIGGVTSFMRDHLGVVSQSSDDGNYDAVQGQGTLSTLGTMSVSPGLGTSFFDTVSADSSAETALRGTNSNGAAVRTDNTFYCVFTFASLINLNPDKAASLMGILRDDWGIEGCIAEEGPCVSLDQDQDGFDMGDFHRQMPLWPESTCLSFVPLIDCL